MKAMLGVLFQFFLCQYLLYLLSSLSYFIFPFSLEFFYAVLLGQNSCHRPLQTWCMWAMGGDRCLILEENCNFIIQTLQSRRILTLKFLLTHQAIFIHQRSMVEGQKNTTHPNLHRHLACGSHLHMPRNSLSIISGDTHFWGLCNIWALTYIR